MIELTREQEHSLEEISLEHGGASIVVTRLPRDEPLEAVSLFVEWQRYRVLSNGKIINATPRERRK